VVPTLKSILEAQTSDEVVLARDFKAVRIERTELGDVEWPVIVQAVLDRTAVVYPAGRVDAKRVVRLDMIMVEEADIKWVPRNPRELQQLRARQVGQRAGRLLQGVVKTEES
jgi:hypothetical protein